MLRIRSASARSLGFVRVLSRAELWQLQCRTMRSSRATDTTFTNCSDDAGCRGNYDDAARGGGRPACRAFESASVDGETRL